MPNAREWKKQPRFRGQFSTKWANWTLPVTRLNNTEERGAGGSTAALIFEEIAKERVSETAVDLTVHNMVTNLIYQYGNEEQRERWVKPLALGEKLGAYSLTQGEAGSDAAALSTSAVKNTICGVRR